MYLIINGYEFGQGLRILLWTGLPATVYLTMVATWLHYRRSRVDALLLLSIEGMEERGAFSIEPEDLSGDGRVDTERSVKDGEEDYKENLYKGILWMKEKYEQYRDLADERYERLKEQLTQMEKKYEDLLMRVQIANPGLLQASSPVSTASPAEEFSAEESPADAFPAEAFPTGRGAREWSAETEVAGEGVGELRQQLEAKQRMIADLEGQLTTDRLTIDALVIKLRNNSQLLTNIYQELDKSLHFSDTPPQG